MNNTISGKNELKTIRVGLVGAGFMGQMHAECYNAMPDVFLVAVCDLREKQAKKIANNADAAVYKTLEAMLTNEEIDVVDVCLPTFLHEEAVCTVFKKGCHCIVEKPIALEEESAQRMQATAVKAGKKLMVGHVIRFWPEYKFLKESNCNGNFGKLLSLAMTRVSTRPGWATDAWMTNPKLSGSALLDLHIHDTDFIRHLLGEPVSVDTCGVKSVAGWDYISTNYHFPNIAVSANGGWNLPDGFPFRMAYLAIFEKGTIDFDCTREPALVVYRKNEKPETPNLGQPMNNSRQTAGNVSDLGGYYNELRYFIDCILRDEEPVLANGNEAIASLKLVQREVASAEANAEN